MPGLTSSRRPLPAGSDVGRCRPHVSHRPRRPPPRRGRCRRRRRPRVARVLPSPRPALRGLHPHPRGGGGVARAPFRRRLRLRRRSRPHWAGHGGAHPHGMARAAGSFPVVVVQSKRRSSPDTWDDIERRGVNERRFPAPYMGRNQAFALLVAPVRETGMKRRSHMYQQARGSRPGLRIERWAAVVRVVGHGHLGAKRHSWCGSGPPWRTRRTRARSTSCTSKLPGRWRRWQSSRQGLLTPTPYQRGT